ncbi:MAG: alcohol dehydrogenase catalytic domain-containing protein [Mycobacteriales bacterium]|nr:alcohol dehydrogenase catalytic domain-containing protein [Frankia sp.]
MRAVVYHAEHDVRVEDIEAPELIAPDDAVVAVTKAGICGSDLHFYNGRLPGVFDGAVVGHEFVGTVVAVGDAVTQFAVGDDVVGSFQIACGSCAACRSERFNHCEDLAVLGYGVFLGDLAGAQAEQVRVPHADINLLRIPPGVTAEAALFVGDILTTGWYAVSIADLPRGSDVLVVGAGPVGIMTMLAAQAQGAGRVVVTDFVASRLEVAAGLGAMTIDGTKQSVAVAVEGILPSGPDVVIETVGLPAALLTSIECVRAGGTVVVIGVHSEFEELLPVGTLFRRNITLRFGGTCNVQGYWRDAMQAVADGRLDPTVVVSHRLPLADAAEGYRLFDSKEALKVVLDV